MRDLGEREGTDPRGGGVNVPVRVAQRLPPLRHLPLPLPLSLLTDRSVRADYLPFGKV